MSAADRRAQRLPWNASIHRWLARHPLLHILFREEWSDLLVSVGFAVLAAGHLTQVQLVTAISPHLLWWWPYEILGTFYLVLYLAFLEAWWGSPSTANQRMELMVILFAALAVSLHLISDIPLESMIASGLILLPGYVPILSFAGANSRKRFLMHAGRAFCALVTSFFVLGFVGSLLERPGVRFAGRAHFQGAIILLWGAVYYFCRGFMQALNEYARRHPT